MFGGDLNFYKDKVISKQINRTNYILTNNNNNCKV